MTMPGNLTRSVVVEREFAHPPEKVWRALTESTLIEQWLMKNDFQPVPGRSFTLHAEPVPNWTGVIDCEVVAVEPGRVLSYTWATLGVETVVTFTLTPAGAGTRLRMEQSGFSPDQEANYKGATYGWRRFIAGMEAVVDRL
jgi:uncharacterized protein YndB with AHSA1/START domain